MCHNLIHGHSCYDPAQLWFDLHLSCKLKKILLILFLFLSSSFQSCRFRNFKPWKGSSVEINSFLHLLWYSMCHICNQYSTYWSCFLWCIVQVYLGQDGQVEVYANMTIQPHSPINRNLLLDQNGAHVYIMTKNTVSMKMFKFKVVNIHKKKVWNLAD